MKIRLECNLVALLLEEGRREHFPPHLGLRVLSH
jgi:hypothetical protein